jgi:histidine ammonia-lyase
MMGRKDIKVEYKDKIISAYEAFEIEKITPFDPKSKEGLALTNGTTFMNSILVISFLQEIHCL